MDQTFTLTEFESLFMIHAAYSDYFFHENEKELLQKWYDYESFERIHTYYMENKQSSFSFLIREFTKYYPQKQSRELLMEKTVKVFYADGVFCDFEAYFKNFFAKI